MGHANQLHNFKRLNPTISGPILEVGSARKGDSAGFRSLFPDQKYIGLDMQAGNGVDVVANIVDGIGELAPASFNLIICVSVLEHVTKPWVAAEHITELLAPGGLLYLSVPWVWRWHGYPDDYWRISVTGIKQLFPDIQWLDFAYTTTAENEIHPVSEKEIVGLENKLRQNGRFPYISVEALGRKS